MEKYVILVLFLVVALEGASLYLFAKRYSALKQELDTALKRAKEERIRYESQKNVTDKIDALHTGNALDNAINGLSKH